MLHFVRSFDYACFKRLRLIVRKRFEVMEKFYLSKLLLNMAGGVMHPPLDPPLHVDRVSMDLSLTMRGTSLFPYTDNKIIKWLFIDNPVEQLRFI